jgi:hypothetical protein
MTKEEKALLLDEKLKTANVLRFAMRHTISSVCGSLTEEQIDDHLSSIATYQATVAYKIEDAMSFGNKIMIEFTTDNIMLGITADGMTGTVRKRLQEVIMCLLTGSLYDAIAEVKAIPLAHKDAKYLTNARLTLFINKIEDYLQIPHTVVT